MLRLLTDRAFRERMVPHIADDVVRSFWTNEFAGWAIQYRTEAVSSVTNKIMPFLTDHRLRAMVEASSSKSLDLRQVLDKGRILIVNVSRGRLGQDNATLLGSLLLTSIEQAALSRADSAESERTAHQLYLDEFQSLVTPSTSIMLSEARKYHLSLTLSHQMTRQLDPVTYHAVIGNCGTLVAFRVGMEDAELLAAALSKHVGHVRPEHLTGLANFSAYARLLIDGTPATTCSIKTLPPPTSEDRSDIVRRVSARTWGHSTHSSGV
jgi:type IV secretory pathway TraG/TraD family ATPase VirD4